MNTLLILFISILMLITVIGLYQLIRFKFYNNNNVHSIYKIPYISILDNEKKNLLKMMSKGKKLNPYRNNFSAKGTKLYYDKLKESMPNFISKLESYEFLGKISNEIKAKISLLNNDDDKIFARLYEEKGDMVDWHYDNNFSNARKFTAIIPVIVDECNTSYLQYKENKTGKIKTVKDDMSTIYIYEGDKIYHKVTEQSEGCKRLVIIVPLYEKPDFTFIGKINNLAKKILYYIFSL